MKRVDVNIQWGHGFSGRLSIGGGRSLELAASVGGKVVSAIGPDTVGAAVTFPPGEWMMRKRWKSLAGMVDDDPVAGRLMAKTTYVAADNLSNR